MSIPFEYEQANRELQNQERLHAQREYDLTMSNQQLQDKLDKRNSKYEIGLSVVLLLLVATWMYILFTWWAK